MKNLKGQKRRSAGGRFPGLRRAVYWVVGVAIGAVVVIAGAYYFDQFTESDTFCGAICHANRPEYVTHEVSDHASVECGTCHIGPGLWPKVEAKIFGVAELYAQVTNSYDRPIELPVERLRPADIICEQCHWPGRLYGERVRSPVRFAEDEDNTPTFVYLALRTGDDAPRPFEKSEIHWHVGHKVLYVATDPTQQDIPWAAVYKGGELVEYRASNTSLTPEELADLPREEMDCLNCHNRAAHVIQKPERVIDRALVEGLIDPALPYVKREAMKLVSVSYSTTDEALEAMGKLEDFYASEYPDVYADKKAAVERAVGALKEVYETTTFPDMNLDWEDYPTNIGHSDFPGCFRCHDGQHVNAEGESIPANCTLCHSVPIVTAEEMEPDASPLFDFIDHVSDVPASHDQSNFIFEHRSLANASCASCHGPIEYGTDNSSFCANGACHSTEWTSLSVGADFVHPIELTGKHAQVTCNQCHSVAESISIENCATCHRPEPEPHYGSVCSDCHTPAGWGEAAADWKASVPSIPHAVPEGAECVSCHASGGVARIPASHTAVSETACVLCHQTSAIGDAPGIPHELEGFSECVECHGPGRLKPFPADHEGRTSDGCLLCHQPGGEFEREDD